MLDKIKTSVILSFQPEAQKPGAMHVGGSWLMGDSQDGASWPTAVV